MRNHDFLQEVSLIGISIIFISKTLLSPSPTRNFQFSIKFSMYFRKKSCTTSYKKSCSHFQTNFLNMIRKSMYGNAFVGMVLVISIVLKEGWTQIFTIIYYKEKWCPAQRNYLTMINGYSNQIIIQNTRLIKISVI